MNNGYNKPPDTNNDCLQMFRDLATELAEAGQTDWHSKITALLQDMQQSSACIAATKEAGHRYNNRQYADIHFSRQIVIEEDKVEPVVVQSLSPAACKVLLLLQTYAKSQYIQVSQPDLELLSGLSHNTLQKALTELKTHDVIEVARMRVRHEPPIYRLSSAVICTGKQRTTGADAKRALEVAQDNGIVLVPKIDIVKCPPDTEDILGGRYAKVSVTEAPWVIPEETEEPTSAGNADAGSGNRNSILSESTPSVNLFSDEEEALFN